MGVAPLRPAPLPPKRLYWTVFRTGARPCPTSSNASKTALANDLAIEREQSRGRQARRLQGIVHGDAVAHLGERPHGRFHMKFYDLLSQELGHRVLGKLKRNEVALELSHFHSSDRVLEVGCAEGFVLRYLLKHNYAKEATGYEISSYKTEQAQKRARSEGLASRLSFVVGDGINLPFADKVFDVVLLPHVLEHIPTKEGMITLLKEAYRVSRFGLLLAVPVRDSRHPVFRWSKYFGFEHVIGLFKYGNSWVYDSKRLLSFLEENGCSARRSTKHDRTFLITKSAVRGD